MNMMFSVCCIRDSKSSLFYYYMHFSDNAKIYHQYYHWAATPATSAAPATFTVTISTDTTAATTT